jgi:hypothetical protein
MPAEERTAWIMLVVSIIAYAAYLVAVLGHAGTTPLAEVPYIPAMLWTIGGAIGASIALNILAGILSPRNAGKKDQRDREIYRFGESMGQSFVVIGAVGAMVLAMAQLPYFWIANTIYLAFVLSAVLSSIAKLVAYRKGLPAW